MDHAEIAAETEGRLRQYANNTRQIALERPRDAENRGEIEGIKLIGVLARPGAASTARLHPIAQSLCLVDGDQ